MSTLAQDDKEPARDRRESAGAQLVPEFRIEAIEPLELRGPAAVTQFPQMSPYVWRTHDGRYKVLVRIAPAPGTCGTGMDRIWLGEGEDGLTFTMDDTPLIAPGPGALDCLGCEDPTVVPTLDRCCVYYTGVDMSGDARLLSAEGPDIRQLRKCGVAHIASATERHTKEATVERLPGDDWRLFFEYSLDRRSRVGVARRADEGRAWDEGADPFVARPGKWDSWHLSTGPLWRRGSVGSHVMFYNGSDRFPRWGIGWVLIDDQSLREVARCEGPVIAPSPADPEVDAHISFASSLIDQGERIWLYFTRNDCTLRRATLTVRLTERNTDLAGT